MFNIKIDYPTTSRNEPRYVPEHTNPHINRAISRHDDAYRNRLVGFERYFEKLSKVDVINRGDSGEAHYVNPFLPGLDAVALYCILAEAKANRYIELGSGYSTRFARRSIKDNGLNTTILSVDPNPRADVGELCDQIIRKPAEEVGLDIFEQLEQNDVLFIDGSHRCFMNSDVTVCFLDILPLLKKGVFVQIHDIWWPVDYPQEWADRYYNEQYLVGTLLANGMQNFEIVLPNYYISTTRELAALVDPLWNSNPRFAPVEKQGHSFWLRRI